MNEDSETDADGLDAAEETIDQEPEPGLGPGADGDDEADDDRDDS